MDCQECRRKEVIIKLQKKKIKSLIESVDNINLMKNHLKALVKFRDQIKDLVNKRCGVRSFESVYDKYTNDLKKFGITVDLRKKEIPEREKWLYENKQALESVQKGLQELTTEEFYEVDLDDDEWVDELED